MAICIFNKHISNVPAFWAVRTPTLVPPPMPTAPQTPHQPLLGKPASFCLLTQLCNLGQGRVASWDSASLPIWSRAPPLCRCSQSTKYNTWLLSALDFSPPTVSILQLFPASTLFYFLPLPKPVALHFS